ncbi:MAG: hypothetical protein FRX49_02425 [Trebouxia sp. A1-2]|nr:MAG: hypothetical protein FRX49_02425 [Trebouxia sp. A1-2]
MALRFPAFYCLNYTNPHCSFRLFGPSPVVRAPRGEANLGSNGSESAHLPDGCYKVVLTSRLQLNSIGHNTRLPIVFPDDGLYLLTQDIHTASWYKQHLVFGSAPKRSATAVKPPHKRTAFSKSILPAAISSC